VSIRNRTPEIKPTMLSVTDGTSCVGFVLNRGRDGYEAFNRDGKPIGKFQSQQEAVRAIPRRAETATP
jgi:hypothetical protein